MRQLLRLARVLFATVTRTLYVSVTARRLPPAARAEYRAYRQQVGCALLCRILGIRVTVEGEMPRGGAPLAVCNHFGILDPLVLASQMPVSFVGKAELRRWPLVGWVTYEFGVIFVHRQRRSTTGSFVSQVRDRLAAGVPVLIFPEGTTNRSSDVMPFKTGGFEAVADVKGATVLPLHLTAVEINGEPVTETSRGLVVWADSTQSFLGHFWRLLRLESVHMRIRIGEPIRTDGLDRKELARESHRAVRALAGEEMRELG